MKQRLSEMYRMRRRNLSENLGIVIALAASCAAMWTGYEAHRARLEAAVAARDSVSVQGKAVQAQIDAMRVDERPYVLVRVVGVRKADKVDQDENDYQRGLQARCRRSNSRNGSQMECTVRFIGGKPIDRHGFNGKGGHGQERNLAYFGGIGFD